MRTTLITTCPCCKKMIAMDTESAFQQINSAFENRKLLVRIRDTEDHWLCRKCADEYFLREERHRQNAMGFLRGVLDETE